MTFFAKSSFAKSYETKLNKTQQDLRLRMVTADWAVMDNRFDCGAVLIVIKTYKYMVYVEIFVTVDCGAVRDGCYHSEP